MWPPTSYGSSAGDDWTLAAILVTAWLFSVPAAGLAGAKRGVPIAGLLLGVFLGPIGVIAACVWPMSPRAAASWQHDVDQHARRISRGVQGENTGPGHPNPPAAPVRCPLCQAEFAAPQDTTGVHCPRCGELVSTKPRGPHR